MDYGNISSMMDRAQRDSVNNSKSPDKANNKEWKARDVIEKRESVSLASSPGLRKSVVNNSF